MHDQVVIRHSIWGSILLLSMCTLFVAGSIIALQDYANISSRAFGIVGIILFGGGGLLHIITMRNPIVTISNMGITVFYTKQGTFVSWENVDRIEVIRQAAGTRYASEKKYIGIFTLDKEESTGVGKVLEKFALVTINQKEMPTLLIDLSFSFVKIKKVMEIMQEFHDKYKNLSLPTQL